MRPQLLSLVIISTITLLIAGLAGPVQAQSCSGYPAGKTWTAVGANKIFETDGGSYPGWAMDIGWYDEVVTHEHPVTVDGVAAQRDRMAPVILNWSVLLKYSTEGSGWTVTGGDELSFSWQVHVSEPGTHYPRLQTGFPHIDLANGVYRLELAFEGNVTGVEDCTLSGWVATSGTVTAGGKEIPNRPSPAERFLPMAADSWHTIRVDLHADGSFDAWVDGGGSDWKHASGIAAGTSETYIRFGLTEYAVLTHEFSTACVAWGEGEGEIPVSPPGVGDEEICDNDDADDDGDGRADCADLDCDCSAINDECKLFVDMIEDFNVEFVEPPWPSAPPPPPPPLGDFTTAPGWSHFGYLAPMRADAETGWHKLPPEDGPGPSASQRLRIATDLIATEGQGVYAGVGGLELPATVEDLVSLPVDWTKPVIVAMDASGSDRTKDGKWQTFVSFSGYTGAGGLNVSHFEWGNNGHPYVQDSLGFLTHRYTLDPGQAGATGTFLRFGLDFDFNPPTVIYADQTNIAFFENVRIMYTYDPTAPILRLGRSVIDHAISCGDVLPDDTFTVTNEGGTTLNYTITDDADWLSIVPDSGGPLGKGQSEIITVMYAAKPPAGEHAATIIVSSPEAFWKTKTINVTLSVTLAPPDYDCDGDVDQSDFAVLQRCVTGAEEHPTPGFCADYADLNNDTYVDQLDVLKFELCASGPGVVFNPDCLIAP